jgi:arylsulfatase A-like enzyme
MRRRDFLQAAAAGAALAPARLPAAGTRGDSDRRPNVVFLLADQWRAAATGYAGDPNAKTPHLDRLASRSVNLTNAVSGCPVCSPYRGSLITGRYPLGHGVFLNDVSLNREAVSLADAFRRSGYRTGYIGKWHLDGHGRSSFIPPERRQGFEFWRADECTHDYNRSLYYADTPDKLLWEGYDAIAQTAEAERYIREHRDGPFALVVSWGPPHNPYQTAPERFRKMFSADSIELRPNVPEEAAAAARQDLAGYYAHCAALDECAGRVVKTLEETGLADDTILVFTSDHGDMLGSHGMQRKQKPWDESIRVPFLVHYPAELGRQGRQLTTPVNAPDIMPTLLGLVGAQIPETVEGTDRSGLLRAEVPDRDEPALLTCPSPFGEWTRARGGREYRGVRTVRYTYVRSLDGPWLLYDNQQDPYQMENLVAKPEHSVLESELESLLSAKLRQTGDDFRPGTEYIEKWGYPVDASGTVPYTA